MSKISSSDIAILRHKIWTFRTHFEVFELLKGLFQKEPHLLNEILDRVGVLPFEDRVKTAHRLIEEKIVFAIGRSEDKNRNYRSLPGKLSAYVFFLDLLTLARDRNLRTWHTFKLLDFNSSQNAEIFEADANLSAYRKRLRKYLPKNSKNSVQIHVVRQKKEGGTGVILFLRVVSAKNPPKNPLKADRTLIKRKPSYFAYFPGSPYVYSISKTVDTTFADALSKCFFSSGWEPVNLSGKHLFSLHRIRSTYESKIAEPLVPQSSERPPESTKKPQNPFEFIRSVSDTDEEEGRKETETDDNGGSGGPPVLNEILIHSNTFFKGKLGGDEDKEEINNFRVTLTVTGNHVLQALAQIAETPLPVWMNHVTRKGVNAVMLRRDFEGGGDQEEPFSDHEPDENVTNFSIPPLDAAASSENEEEEEAES